MVDGRRNPKLMIQRQALDVIHRASARFGLSPVDRVRLEAKAVEEAEAPAGLRRFLDGAPPEVVGRIG